MMSEFVTRSEYINETQLLIEIREISEEISDQLTAIMRKLEIKDYTLLKKEKRLKRKIKQLEEAINQ